MKVKKQETLYHKDHGATLKHKCGKKDSSIAPFIFLFFWPFFLLFFLFFWDNTQWMMIITLLFIYNSMITTRYQNKVWLYMNASGGVPGWAMNQEWHVWIICMVALPQIRCQLHDHARQYDNDETCHDKWNGGKLHGNISWNGYGNARIGRYGAVLRKI